MKYVSVEEISLLYLIIVFPPKTVFSKQKYHFECRAVCHHCVKGTGLNFHYSDTVVNYRGRDHKKKKRFLITSTRKIFEEGNPGALLPDDFQLCALVQEYCGFPHQVS
jgi:hypothetical protein